MAQQDLRVNITGNSSGLSNALTSASSKLEAFGSKMQSVGKNLSTRLTLPLVAAGAAAVKMAFDFDKSMTSIQALVGVSASEVSKMGEAAKRMAIDTGKSANEAAEALFFITSAGLRGDQAMQVLEASLKAAAVGLGETKTIADLSTSALNAYGAANLSATDATDILTAAVREGKLEASQLAGAMGGVIPLASNMGVRFDEVAAAMAAMSRTGTNAAEGATQLNAILASLKKPTAEAENALISMGMSTDSVQKSLRDQGLLATLEMLQNSMTKTGLDTTAIFPNIRALKGVLDLTGAGLEDNRKIFDALTNSMGATDEAFQKTSESASFKMTKGLNAMKSSLLDVGNVILTAVAPAVESIGNFFTKLSESFKNLSPETQKIILVIAGIAAAIGPVLVVLGSLISMAPAVASAFALMTGPVGLLIAALAAVAVVIYKNWAGIKTALINIANYFIELYNNSLPIQLAVNALIMYFKNMLAVGKFVFKSIVAVFKAFGSAAIGILGGVGDLIMGIFTLDVEKIKKGFLGIGSALKTGFSDAFDGIKENAKILGENVVDNFNDALKTKKIKKLKVNAEVVLDSGSIAAPSVGDVESTLNKNPIIQTFKPVVDPKATGGTMPSVSAIGGGLEMAGIATPITDAIKLDTALIPAAMDEQQQILLEKRTEALERTMAFNQGLNQIVTGGLNDLAVGIGQSLGQALSSGGNLTQKLSKVVLSTIGSMAQQLGTLAIGMGKALSAITIALKSLNPAVAIAAGIALVALGAFVSAQAGKIGSGGGGGGGGATAFAKGGIVSGPTMGLVGEYPGARSNPEVIAPLDKLQNMIGGNRGTQNINVGGQIRLEGQDLLIAIERANETAGRIY